MNEYNVMNDGSVNWYDPEGKRDLLTRAMNTVNFRMQITNFAKSVNRAKEKIPLTMQNIGVTSLCFLDY